MDKARVSLLAHSQLMYECALSDRWSDLARLELQFLPMLEAYFADKDAAEPAMQDLLLNLMAQNEAIVALLKKGQLALLQQQAQDEKNNRALHSYLQASD